jgi:hypothetical protein
MSEFDDFNQSSNVQGHLIKTWIGANRVSELKGRENALVNAGVSAHHLGPIGLVMEWDASLQSYTLVDHVVVRGAAIRRQVSAA